MEPRTIIAMSDGREYGLPHALEELLEILTQTRRLGEFPGLELVCDCGTVWVNPDQVVSVTRAINEEESAQIVHHSWPGRG
jgi:hypothetical protein